MARWTTWMRWIGAAALMSPLAYVACGGGASGTGSQGGTATVATPSAVTDVLDLNFNALPAYASEALPVHYDAQVQAGANTPGDDPITDKGATLGRVLFYDKALSTTGTISCATCHVQADGFAATSQFSEGVQAGVFGTRHAMRLGNARFYTPGSMFWDKRAPTLEAQTTQPIQNPIEMGFDADHGGLAALEAKLAARPYYPPLFTLAFGDPAITDDRIARALSQFVRSLVSSHSRWDDGAATTYDPTKPGKGLGLPKPNFTDAENRGQQLFFAPKAQGGAGCAACHVAPTFALNGDSQSNGLDAGETVIFKAPSLKHAPGAGRFMHDGRFATLAEVVAHYDHGVQDGPALDRRLRGPDGQPQRLNLSDADQAALVAFLETLEDPVLPTDSRFSDPFKP
ncbi:MAG TPA: cytochrome c peroxidase [Holophagaceae bacterium]|nr:cytochrome c peroxidase [Holophagaceae bacterium]